MTIRCSRAWRSQRRRISTRNSPRGWSRSPSVARDGKPPLLREQPRRVLERLELERVAGRIVEEHRRLLAHLAREADARFDLETGPRATEFLGENVPGMPLEHHAEMRHGHVVSI